MNNNNKNKKWWDNPVFNTALHVLSTSCRFAIIATAAYLLNLYVHFLEANGASAFLVQVLTVFENVILVIDVLWALYSIVHGIIKEFFDE